jgi:hypothetical protein
MQGNEGIGVVKFLSFAAISSLTFVILAEMAVGCGQVTYFQDRTWRSNECLFINSKISYGRW